MPWTDLAITCAHLVLRPFTAADADEALACITPTLTRYLSFDPPADGQAFEAVWRGWLAGMASGTDWNFVLRERGSGRFLGLLGLHRAHEAEPELGIWIREDAHGKGHGREAVAALAAWARAQFAPRAFVYPVAEANTASRRIAQGLGGEVVARQQRPKYPAVVYRIPAATLPE
ncbi:MAG: GNAT family N-acetyltransferase [Burkholderiaceae bacterium]|nr:GNAT family N-acetyltransferase [Burkholderiaceae bacterium]